MKKNNFKTNLLFTTALTTSLFGYYRRAYSGSCGAASQDNSERLCSGVAGLDVTQEITSDAVITTSSDFALNVATGNGIDVNVTDAVSFTDYSTNSIITTELGSSAIDVSSGDGAVIINLSGDLTSEGDAIKIDAGSTAVTVNSDAVIDVDHAGNGDGDGIDITTDTAGADVTVSVEGKVYSGQDIVGNQDNGIYIKTTGDADDIRVVVGSTGYVYGKDDAIDIDNHGIGYSSVVIEGTVNSNTDNGVEINSYADSSSAYIKASAGSDIYSDYDALRINNSGESYAKVVVEGNIDSANYRGVFIHNVEGTNATNAIVTNSSTGEINAETTAVKVWNYGSGYSKISSYGTVNSTSSDGLYIYNDDSATNAIIITGDASEIDAGVEAIQIRNFGTGNSTITAGGNITSNGSGDAIYAFNKNAGDISVTTNTNSVVVSSSGDGIYTSNYAGATTVVVNGNITAPSNGLYLTTSVAATGAIVATIGSSSTVTAGVNGIAVANQGSGSATLNIDGATIIGNKAIYSSNNSALTTNLDGSSSAVTITGTGGTAIDFKGADDTLTITGAATIAGNVSAGGGTDALTLNNANLTISSGNFSGFETTTITGDNIITGNLALAGVTITTGGNSSLKVNDGTLTVSALNLSSGSTLSGGATIVGNVTALSGSTIAPGNSIGTQTITGTLDFASGSNFDVEIDGNSADKIDVTGAITIDSGATLNVIPLNGTTSGSATILTSTGGITGTFGTVTSTNSAVSLVYTDDLNLSFITADTSIFASQIQSSVNNSILFNDTLTSQIADSAFAKGNNFWMRGISRDQNSSSSNSNQYGVSSRAKGVAFGAQKDFNDSYKIGFSLSQINDNLGIKGAQGSRTGESTLVSVYGLYNKEIKDNLKLFSSLSLGLGYHDGKNKRLVSNSGVESYASSFTNDTDISLTAQLGAKIEGFSKSKNDLYLMPLVSATYIKTFAGGFEETGGGNSSVTIHDYSFATLKLRESVRLGTDEELKLPTTSISQLNSLTFSPYFEMGLAQERAISGRNFSGKFFNGTNFSAGLNKDDRNFLTTKIGTKAKINEDISAFISYERSTSNQENRDDLRAGVLIGF